MKVNITPNRLLVTAVSALVFMVALLIIGVVVGAAISKDDGAQSHLKLMANSAARGTNVSMATAQIDETNEGLYILDHLNGNLQCWVLNPRTGKIGGVFRGNLFEAIPTLKQGGDLDFVLTTGLFDFQNRGNKLPGQSIAFVAEGKSGIVAGFGLQYDRTAIQRGGVQEGPLEVILQGPIRELQLRDQ